MIVPILTYGSEIWGYEYSEVTEKIQAKFCKKILKVPTCASNIAVLGELGRLPLCTHYMVRCVKYWLKIVCMQEDRYPKAAYNMLYELDRVGRKTWASQVKNLLCMHGFGIVWLCQDVGNHGLFMSEFKQRVSDHYRQMWFDGKSSSPKLVYYDQFKGLLEPAKYLSCVVRKDFRIALTRYRISCHVLEIEIGRRNNTTREERVCKVCMQNSNIYVIEDEFHMLCVCPLYSELRDAYGIKCRDMVSSCSMLASQNENCVNNLAAFIYNAFKLRNTYLQV
jgi:hypothetical protein